MEKTATNANFAELIKTDGPILVDFWATWCGPCRMISPLVSEIAEEYAGKATVIKVNVDECDEVAAEYRIRSIPTLLFIKNGEIVDKIVGAVPKTEIASKLAALL